MKLRKQLAKMLDRISQRLVQDNQRLDKATPESLFTPLTPVLNLKHFENYANAFEAIEHNDVTCVAVSGPYGSGKSSILRAYKTTKPYLNFIEISLATFEEELASNDKKSKSDAIEKSILQQLIYSVSRDDLPYSRFRKIRPPSYPEAKAGAITLFAALSISAALFWAEIKVTLFEAPFWWKPCLLGLGALAWLTGLYTLILSIYRASVGLSLKKLSLKNGEIETSSETEQSVFNRHLDEILYFFQESECDIVLIEDLDRFEDNTEIFTKIREVNLLINQNETIKKKRSSPIKFIFAVKDDLFREKNRTKFFDLIIPVIPYASSSNSYALLCNNLRQADLLEELDKAVIRNLAVHMNDNRLLLNTLNEFRLYALNLRDGNLKPTKLFATVVYKNFFPTDFGKLHDHEGEFAALLDRYESDRDNRRTSLEQELSDQVDQEEEYLKITLKSREALANAYWGALQRHPEINSIRSVYNSPRTTRLTDASSGDEILTFFQEPKKFTIEAIGIHSRQVNRQIDSHSIAELVHPESDLKTILERIDSRKEDQLEINKLKATEIQKEIRELSFKSLADIIPENALEDSAQKTKYPNLFVYLIRNGLLGRDFADYMTYFHKGAMTLADRQFCQQFDRAESTITARPIDDPAEVLETLGDRIFQKTRGFNVKILDHILEDSGRIEHYSNQLAEGFKDLHRNLFPQFETYFMEGQDPDSLLSLISRHWQDYFEILSHSREHFAIHSQAILQWASHREAKQLRRKVSWLTKLQDQAAKVFSPPVAESALEILPDLGIQFPDLAFPLLSTEERGVLISAIIKHNQWQFNKSNLLNVLKHSGLSEKGALQQPVTSVLSLKDQSISRYLFDHLEPFIKRCFLQIEESVHEAPEGLERLLNIKGLEPEIVTAIIERQRASLPFEAVLAFYWETLIEFEKFEFTWENIDYYAESRPEDDPFSEDETSPSKILLLTNLSSELAKNIQPVGDNLRWAVYANDDLEDAVYFSLAQSVLGELDSYPQPLSLPKKRHLATQNLVELSEEAIAWADNDPEIISILVSLHRDEYFEDPEVYNEHLSNTVIYHLLATDLTEEQKRFLCSELTPTSIGTALVKAIHRVVQRAEPPFDFLSDEVIRAMIALPIDPSFAAILIPTRLDKWNHEEVMEIINSAPPPLDKISEYGKHPKLPDKAEFLEMIQRLDKAGHISSFKRQNDVLKVHTRKNPL